MAGEPRRSKQVSVIVPTYNRARFVTDAMDSVWEQDYRPIELIVVDDGSTDDTAEAVDAWAAAHASDEAFRTRYLAQENRGAPAARNHGIREATGTYTKFLDSDDLLDVRCLQKQVREMQQVGEHEIVFGDLGSETEDGKRKINKTYASDDGGDPFAYALGLIINTPLPLHRTRLLREVKGFREGLPKGQEYDLHLRLTMHGVRFVYREGCVAYVRQVGDDVGISDNISLACDPAPVISFHDNRRALALAHYDDDVPPAPAQEVAQGYWSIGRELCRHGEPAQALSCFAKARTVVRNEAKAVAGSRLYRALVRFLGPIYAERVLMTAKALLRRLPLPAP